MEQENIALDWDSEVDAKEVVSNNFETLPDGEYNFTVKEFKRDSYNGSDKMPACPVAEYTILVEGNGKRNMWHEKLFLVASMQGKCINFFVSLGLVNKDHRGKLPWNEAVGKSGKCRVGSKTYNDKVYNTVKFWIAPKADEY